ncbi:MAG TPA: PEGA domain-containing protein [Candidatus Binatia bacterium]|nr:PEGA domain-containing protein [Candidatus Binatia bacterium]
MSNRTLMPMVVVLLIGIVLAENQVQSELRFAAHSKDEKTAGVWVDGQYVGFVKELAGDKKLRLLPGKHEIVIRQAWYNEFVKNVILEPGQSQEVKVELVKSARLPTQDATAEVKIAATPSRAAVFVDGQYAGHVDEFDGVGKAMLLTPGQHRLHIALPGYLPFDTMVDLRSQQKLKIQTDLVKGSITEAGSEVNKR